MRRRFQLVCGLALVVACGFANPVAHRPDGTSATSRTRIGIASSTFHGNCDQNMDCAVQISMGHTGTRARRVDVVGVRLIVGGVDIGSVPVSNVTQWRGGAYRSWTRTIRPYLSTKLSIEVGPVRWEQLLESRGIEDYRTNIHVEIDLAIDGEPVVVRSMFAVQREPEPAQSFFVT